MTIPQHARATFSLRSYTGRPAVDGTDGLPRLYGPEAARPQELFARLRARDGQVSPVMLPGDLPVWLVLGHRANLDVARTPSRFSRDSRRWNLLRSGQVPADWPLRPMVEWEPSVVFSDGEEHERTRAAIVAGLAAENRAGIRRYVKRYTEQLVNLVIERGHADLISEYAERLPMLVMTRLLGLDEAEGPRLADAARDLIRGSDTAVASNELIKQTLIRLIATKKARPGRDFASRLIAHESRLQDSELLSHLRLTLIAANETTANLIANTLERVLTDGRFRAHLAGGQMTLPDALDGVLWDEPPLSTVPGRWATGDSQLGGWRIEGGDMLLLCPGAANVDPEIRPDLSVPVHGNRSHLAFSAGPHRCPGDDLGRAIADTGIDTLMALLPDLRLAVPQADLDWHHVLLSKRLSRLPVEFQARPRVALGSTRGAARRTGAGPGAAGGCPVTHGASAPAPTPSSDVWASTV
ncbi:cytochrome P450 [Streptomyces sp. NPDC047117]|uniref:cytochrome P450 n=1 Tax=unclassified Streptomyces TaxID=2593676 RepID=UPI0033F1D834